MKNLFVLVLLAITLGCNCAPLKRGSQDDFRAMRITFPNCWNFVTVIRTNIIMTQKATKVIWHI